MGHQQAVLQGVDLLLVLPNLRQRDGDEARSENVRVSGFIREAFLPASKSQRTNEHGQEANLQNYAITVLLLCYYYLYEEVMFSICLSDDENEFLARLLSNLLQ